MSGPPGAAGRPPRRPDQIPDHVRFEPQPDDEPHDPLNTDVYNLRTFDHSSPMIAQQVTAPETTFPRVGAGSAERPPAMRPSRLVVSQLAREVQARRRRARRERWIGFAFTVATWLIVGALVGIGSLLGTWALVYPDAVLAARQVSTLLAAMAVMCLFAAFLLLLVFREGRRK